VQSLPGENLDDAAPLGGVRNHLEQHDCREFNWNAISIGVAVGLALSAAMTWDLRRGHHQPDKDTKP
jgi:hypothetical protein